MIAAGPLLLVQQGQAPSRCAGLPGGACDWRRQLQRAECALQPAQALLAQAQQPFGILGLVRAEAEDTERCGSPWATSLLPPAAPAPATRPAEAAHATARHGDAEPARDAPVRVHVDEADEGVRVWLGVDGAAPLVAARAAAAVSELRRTLADSAQRLATVVCNGSTVYGLAAANAPPTPASPPRNAP